MKKTPSISIPLITTPKYKKPDNGKYLTKGDFVEWSEYFGELVKKEELQCDSKEFYNSKVKNITFAVTDRCNLRCTYCYESHDAHKYGNIMTKETGKEAVDLILDRGRMNGYIDERFSEGVILEFIGGEPLLEIELVDYLTDYFKMRAFELDHPWATNYKISISTNGTLYFGKKVQRYLQKNKSQLSLNITVDGNKKLHDTCRLFEDGSGSYDIVEKAFLHWNTETLEYPSTKLTLAPENVSYLKEAVINLWENLGAININANPVYEEGWELEHAQIYYKQLKEVADYILDNDLHDKHYISLFDEYVGKKDEEKRNYCGGNGDMLAIDPTGKCFPCLRYLDHSMKNNRKSLIIGGVKEGIDSDNPELKKLQSITMETQSPLKCQECKIGTGCGLCSAFQYDKFGDANVRATYICKMHQVRVMLNSYFWNKIYAKLDVNKKFKLDIPKEWAVDIISEDEYKELLDLQ